MTVKRPLVMNQAQIGKFIREIRLQTGLTQEQFAAELGVTYSSINRWENGRSKPSPLAIQKIEGILRQMGDHGKDLLERYLASAMRWSRLSVPPRASLCGTDVESLEGASGNEAGHH